MVRLSFVMGAWDKKNQRQYLAQIWLFEVKMCAWGAQALGLASRGMLNPLDGLGQGQA